MNFESIKSRKGGKGTIYSLNCTEKEKTLIYKSFLIDPCTIEDLLYQYEGYSKKDQNTVPFKELVIAAQTAKMLKYYIDLEKGDSNE